MPEMDGYETLKRINNYIRKNTFKSRNNNDTVQR